MNEFEAMYYPYASIQNKETLKQSLIYFDKIHILSPTYSIGEKSEELYRGNKIYDELNEKQILDPQPKSPAYYMEMALTDNEWKRIEKEFEPVERKWLKKSSSKNIIISLIDPQEIYEKHYREILDSVKVDLNDDDFKKLADGKKWLLFKDKIDALIPSFRNKITSFDRKHHDYECLVDGDLAESILLNHAIFASIDKKLTPFTDELEHSRLLNRKMQRNYELMKDYLLEEGYIDDIKQNLLAKKVLEINLSGVEGVSYSDILDFRDDNKSELKSFRIEMGRISTSISSKPWTPEFDSEVAQKIKSEINPKVQDLEDKSKEFKDNMLEKYGKNVVIPVAISLGATVYAGVPLSLAVIGSTLLAKLRGENIIDVILKDWKDWRHQNRNSITYLLNLNKLSS